MSKLDFQMVMQACLQIARSRGIDPTCDFERVQAEISVSAVARLLDASRAAVRRLVEDRDEMALIILWQKPYALNEALKRVVSSGDTASVRLRTWWELVTEPGAIRCFRSHPDVVADHDLNLRLTLRDIVAAGVRSREFQIDDVHHILDFAMAVIREIAAHHNNDERREGSDPEVVRIAHRRNCISALAFLSRALGCPRAAQVTTLRAHAA